MNQTLVVVGGGGFIGEHLTAVAKREAPDLEVFVLDAATPLGLDTKWIPVDICERDKLIDVFGELAPSLVVHLASPPHRSDLRTLVQVNILGTRNVMIAASATRNQDRMRVLYVSSSAVYGGGKNGAALSETDLVCPVTDYGITKAAAEMLVLRDAREHGVEAVIARPFNIVGPGQPPGFVCADLVRKAVEAEKSGVAKSIEVGRLDAERDFIDVRDVAQALWRLAEKGQPSTTYNIAWCRSVSISEVAEMVARYAHVSIAWQSISPASDASEIDVQVGDNRRMMSDMDWSPGISLERSIEEMIAEERAKC